VDPQDLPTNQTLRQRIPIPKAASTPCLQRSQTKHKHSPGLKGINGDTNLRSKTVACPAITNRLHKRFGKKKLNQKKPIRNQKEKRFQSQATESSPVGDEFASKPRTDPSEVIRFSSQGPSNQSFCRVYWLNL
jgi:hypothetical protein